MDRHISVVGVLHIGFGILGILLAALLLIFTIGPGVLIYSLEGEPLPLTILSVIGGSIALFMVILSLPGIVGGIGLLKFRPWARYLVMILGVIDLILVPIGTILGAYTLIILVDDRSIKIFYPETDEPAA
jgi:hypothetical protein